MTPQEEKFVFAMLESVCAWGFEKGRDFQRITPNDDSPVNQMTGADKMMFQAKLKEFTNPSTPKR